MGSGLVVQVGACAIVASEHAYSSSAHSMEGWKSGRMEIRIDGMTLLGFRSAWQCTRPSNARHARHGGLTTRMRFAGEFTCSADGLESQLWIKEYFYFFCAQSFRSIMLYWAASVSIIQTISVSLICRTKIIYLSKLVDDRGFWFINEHISRQYSILRGLGIHHISL